MENCVSMILASRTLLISKLPHSVLTPCMHRSSASSLMKAEPCGRFSRHGAAGLLELLHRYPEVCSELSGTQKLFNTEKCAEGRMGVPKFYRWISERFPCLSEVVKEHQIPEFDNLYLDMNGIIHQCSHPNDEDVHFRISEEKIFSDIFHYLEVLFRIIRPRKVFFMAVDGKALEKGEVLPTEARFDSNCITPGTEFMVRLQEQLQYFVNNKLTSDHSWQGVRVYLSGHETPGEGEHKIMEFIRSENARPGHDPNTRHCLYGLDADLIMLGLTSHEPHFSLLREEVRFGGKKSQKRIATPEETTFHLLHLSLMREYIDYEFSALRTQIGFEYDLERIIDDWVLMGFLVGNDFIPHLPHLHINHDALPLLYRTYISVLPKLGGYLNENGHLNLHNFEKYLEKLSEDSALCLATLASANKEQPEEEEEEDEMFETEFRQYKRTYYMNKLGVAVVSDEFLADHAKCYVEGIQWILHYYYHGVQSWSWNIAGLRLTFDLGRPFMPFQQLLAVLPAASKDLLPLAYRHLMTSQTSSILQYYPLDFRTDLNGKQQEWEAVVLIPFIDERCLLAAMDLCNDRLTAGEVARNRHSECSVFTFDPEVDVLYPSSLRPILPNITHCHVRQTRVPLDAWHVSVDHPSRGENTILEIIQQGAPLCEEVADQLLGRSVFVNWPHLEEAREPPGVQKVYEGPSSRPPSRTSQLSDKENKDWLKDVQGSTEQKYVPLGDGSVVLEKQWARQVLHYPYQTVVKPYYGAMGESTSCLTAWSNIRDGFTVPLGLRGTLVGIQGADREAEVLYEPYYGAMGEKANVGLNLKFTKKNEEVPGYTRRTDKEFSEVFELVSRNSHDDVFYEDDIWPADDQNGAQKVSEITSWLREHPVSSVGRTSCDLQPLEQQQGVVPDPDAEYQLFDRVVNIRDGFTVPLGLRGTLTKKSSKKVRVTVRPHLLFRPLEQQQGVVPDPDAEYQLFDRVVNIRDGFTVPLGLRGTLVGIQGADREAEVLYEVVFDEEFVGGLTIRCPGGRGYRLPSCSLINLSHGTRLENGAHKLMAIVKPQPSTQPRPQQAQPRPQQAQPRPQQASRPPFTPTQNNTKLPGGQRSDLQGGRTLTHKHNTKGPGGLRLLKRSDESNTSTSKASTEFEELLANLKISHSNQQISHSNQQGPAPLPPPQQASNQSDGPLSPQSFAMEATSQPGGAAQINAPHVESPAASNQTRPLPLGGGVVPGVVAELSRVCMGLGLGAPDISCMRTRQGLIGCQVKLSNGLVLQGPQSPSEHEAKEKAALLTLQRLTSMGLGFPLPPSMFSGIGPMRPPHMGATPPLFNPSGGVLMPPQAYGPLWGLPPPQPSQHFFMGPAPSLPIGSHNQFVPLQVTKKRASSNRKCPDGREFYRKPNPPTSQHAGQSQGQGKVDPPPGNRSPAPSSQPEDIAVTTAPYMPPRQAPPHTPGSASKRRHRKLAVNFLPAKIGGVAM
ncbi:hypothetical protein CRUP_015991 [Coryphaenoides rupestris]|nr:hypothetical protein CRUP_015991 [Coryphaenoides rupestris]